MTKQFKKHTKRWFLNRIGKIVYCTEHIRCDGVEIDSDIAANNLFKYQDNGVKFYEKS